MTTRYMTNPKQKITVTHDPAGTPVTYTFENRGIIDWKITRRENAWDIATVNLTNPKSLNYSSRVSRSDQIIIEVQDADESSWTKLFGDSYLTACNPMLTNATVLNLKADGAGWPLAKMLVAEEYGTQSSNPTLDTIKEILIDGSYGIIDKSIHNLLGSATTSGHWFDTAQAIADDQIEAIAGTILYLYFAYKPAGKAINDVCDYVQAIKGAAAGPHWLLTPDSEFLLSTIGSHHANVVTVGWTNYFQGDQDESTLVQGRDFTQYWFQELDKEANYILYYGRLRKPGSGDLWTESNAVAMWDTSVINAAWQCTMSNDAGVKIVGANSTEAYCDNVASAFDFCFPSSKDMGLNVSKMGGEHSIPTLSFYVQCDANVDRSGVLPFVFIGKFTTGPPIVLDGWQYDFSNIVQTDDKWYHFNLPIGDYWRSSGKDFDGWLERNTGTWTDVDIILFKADSKAGVRGKMYIDGLALNGYVIRVARQTAAYSTTDPCRMKIITDDEGKDDSLLSGTPGTTDLGTMARLAKAEYLRSCTTPIVGWVDVKMVKDCWPGMLVHVHAEKKADGTFNLDKDMRVSKLEHSTRGGSFNTRLYLTDDVLNSLTRPAYNDMNLLLQSMRPEFQDRQATSLKMREMDITQARLSESY